MSVQLWSVKDELKADFKGTLEQIADMGFDGVEFAGDFGPYTNDPKGLKTYLDSLGLKASGAHVGTATLMENLDDTAAFYQHLGIQALIIPWDDRAFDGDRVHELIDDLKTIDRGLKPYKMQVGYHNHAEEWADYAGTSYYEFIAANTPDSVILQQDVGWTLHAQKDPIAFVQAHPGRIFTTHFKSDVENQPGATPLIGQDDIDWLAIFTATVKHGGASWIVLEQEAYPNGMRPMEALQASKKGFDHVLQAQ
ncbi:sugar phosphate isomerase/epimerase [Aestuariibacter sp. A3R04]|nr:sugar phosphate isomerase/epimerase [Aestuariibacter sp. A3R04]